MLEQQSEEWLVGTGRGQEISHKPMFQLSMLILYPMQHHNYHLIKLEPGPRGTPGGEAAQETV